MGAVSGFASAAFWATVPWAAGAVLLVLAVTFIVAKIVGKHSVIDTAWGLLFVAVAVTAFIGSIFGAGGGARGRRAASQRR